MFGRYLAQCNSKDVCLGPVQEVEIVIIDEVGGIKDLVWALWDESGGFGV